MMIRFPSVNINSNRIMHEFDVRPINVHHFPGICDKDFDG